ncbi:beta-lactamase hydrolase domain-containing protein [Oscillatoria salina]|uniref:beta-lactamase hydrolase domain-containing protein n=1 Tax=Oscillatoria salina TaxID=331517 RepID=UPI0013BC1DE0|nr:sulfur transferase domain-containing protein [Oscillatoria salina]MBZ8180284.1 hypothetical protein [Oscillatoria salina IIICB1]NET87754.1 hypothetical protein [Kamptonema sp. SIO1D9]
MFQSVSESLAIGNLNSREKLSEIAQQGYRTIVDLCTPPEGNQLNPEEVTQLGFDYLSIPVFPKNLKPETLQTFIQAVDSASQPIYIRCASGLRAGMMALLTIAEKQAWTEQQYLEQWEALGLENKPNSPLASFVQEYFQAQSS